MLDIFLDCKFTTEELELIKDEFIERTISEPRENCRTMLHNIINYINTIISASPSKK